MREKNEIQCLHFEEGREERRRCSFELGSRRIRDNQLLINFISIARRAVTKTQREFHFKGGKKMRFYTVGIPIIVCAGRKESDFSANRQRQETLGDSNLLR